MATVTNFANAFETTLTADMLGTDLTAQVQTTDGAPSSPCYLVIDPHNDDKREYVLFDGSFTTTSFATTALANRYLDGSAAASGITHAAGSIVRFSPVAQHFRNIQNSAVWLDEAQTISGAKTFSTAADFATADIDAMRAKNRPWFDVTHPDYGATGDGTTDDSAAFLAAIQAAKAVDGRVVVPPPASKYLISTQVTDTLAATESVEIVGIGNPTIRSDVDRTFNLSAPSVATPTVTAKVTKGDTTITVDSTTGIQAGDVIVLAPGLILETGWHYVHTETHVVESVPSATSISLAGRVEFTFSPFAAVVWSSVDGSTTRFWYPSYYIAAADIEVLVNGVVQTAGTDYTTTRKLTGSDAQGHYIDFTSAPAAGANVTIRRVSGSPVTAGVNRGGKLRVSGLQFESTNGETHLYARRLYAPEFSYLRFTADNNAAEGDYLYLADCVSPSVDAIDVEYGRYGVFVMACRDARVENVTGREAWHPVAVATFANNTRIRRVRGYDCQSVVDSHPALDTHMDDIQGYGEDGLNNRAYGGSLTNVDVTAIGAGDKGFEHQVAWVSDGDDAPAKYMPWTRDFEVRNVNIDAPNSTGTSGGFYIAMRQVHRSTFENVTIGEIKTGRGSLGSTGCDLLLVRGSTVDVVEMRQVNDLLSLVDSGVGYLLGFSNSSQGNNNIVAVNTVFDDATQIIKDDLGTNDRDRTFVGCTFKNAATLVSAIDISGGFSKSYMFAGCTFDAIGGFLADLVSVADFISCRFVNGTTQPKYEPYTPILPVARLATGMEVASGGPARAMVGAHPAWLMDAASYEAIHASWEVPAGVTSVNVDVVWANASTGTGDVTWRLDIGSIADGEDSSSITPHTTATVTAGLQYIRQSTRLASPMGVTPGELLVLRLWRRAGDATDTLPNDAGVFALRVTAV